MSFAVWAALAIVGLVVGPVIAHLLRRGRTKEREFPPVRWALPLTSNARERSRLEDRPLLALRTLMIVSLAVLGAMPLVRCERLSLARTSGGSVALAVVLDDSFSMRAASPNGASRFSRAFAGAEQLFRSARPGDSLAIVLAGKPARVLLSPTTDLDTARRTLADVVVSDRSTDLVEAVALARNTIRSSPQKDHKVVVLSDLAGEAIPEGTPFAETPLADLAKPASDCGITTADRHGTRVDVVVACSDEDAARHRTVDAVVATGAAPNAVPDGGGRLAAPGEVVGHGTLSPRAGEQHVTLDVGTVSAVLDVRLTGSDAAREDDDAPVSDEPAAPAVAVVADTRTAGATTGGPTVVEQALAALGGSWVVRPLELIPDDEGGYKGVAALVLDDPRGLSPTARTALSKFLSRGGVAAAFIGPRGSSTDLGSPLDPFAHGTVRFESAPGMGVDPASVAWLGAESTSLQALVRRGRARLDGTELEGARVVGRFTDSVPFLVERAVGRGLCLTVGLPASLEESDFAVRPGFLSILDHVLRQADQRKGSKRTAAGVPWTFPGAARVVVEGPEGPVPVTSVHRNDACADATGRCDAAALQATPALHGRYRVVLDGEQELRTVTLDPAELLAAPREPSPGTGSTSGGAGALVSASRETALVLLAFVLAEVSLRIGRRWAARTRGRPGSPIGPERSPAEP
ncbi:MAG TPA: VWA domain-containing protein [Polyangiaceae bacterium]|nr:VWA domain-containing protein [Polyangiaceae bacterium]